MRLLISACTDKAFSDGFMPLAHMSLGAVQAENDNQPRQEQAVHARRQPEPMSAHLVPTGSGQRFAMIAARLVGFCVVSGPLYCTVVEFGTL